MKIASPIALLRETLSKRMTPSTGRFLAVAIIVLLGLVSASLAQDHPLVSVVRDDGGHPDGRGQVCGPTQMCMKVLNLELDPATVTQARIMYYMKSNPYDVGTKASYNLPVEAVKWSHFVVTLNGHEVLRESLVKHGATGWHEIPVDPALLVCGENKITMTLDGPGSYFYLGVDHSASRERSASSNDGGRIFRTNCLNFGNETGGGTAAGEYMVRLKLWAAPQPEVGFTERDGHHYGWLEVEDLFSTTRPHAASGFKTVTWKAGSNAPSRGQVAYGMAGKFEVPFDIPAEGDWLLWLRGWMDGLRGGAFTLSWDGKPFYSSQGKHEFTSDAPLRFDWPELGVTRLGKGRHVLGVQTTGDCGHMFDVLVLTTDPAYRPDESTPLPRMTLIEKLVPPEGLASLSPGLYMTEHPLPWARQVAGGPLRTLWVCAGINDREIVELQQRMDMPADVVSLNVPTDGDFQGELDLDKGDLLYNLLAADKPYDVAVLVRTKLNQIPDHALVELLRRVEQGMGLIVVSSKPESGGATKLAALLKEAKPLNLPAFKVPFDLGRQKDVGWCEYGKGRVFVRAFSQWGTVDSLKESMETRGYTLENLRFPFWEYQFGQWVKLLLKAGRRDMARIATVECPETLQPGQAVELAVTTDGAEGTQLVGSWWGPHAAAPQRWESVACRDGKSVVKLPSFTEDGLYCLQLSLLDAQGKVLDCAATYCRVQQPARVTDLQAVYSSDQGGQVVATLKTVNSNGVAHLPALLEVYGSRGRLLSAQEMMLDFPAGEGKCQVTATVLPSWERVLEARLTIRGSGGVPIQRVYHLFTRPQPVVLDDYISWAGVTESCEMPTYCWSVYARIFDNMGIKAYKSHPLSWNSLEQGPVFADPFRLTKVGSPSTGVGGERIPCLHDPGMWAKEETAIRQLVRYSEQFSPLILGLGDEMTVSATDEVCFSKLTLAAFREHLQKQYGTIQKLNATWQSQFADWDAVIPWKVEQTRQRPENIAPWLEFRVFMTRTLVESIVKMQKWVKEEAPDIHTGGVNPVDESYKSCAVFSEIYPMLDYAQIYPRFHDRARSWFRDPRLTGLWSGYDYNRENIEQQAWLLPAYGGTFMGWFGAGRTFNYHTLTNTINLGERGQWIRDCNHELQAGIGKLLIEAEVEQEPVAILSSYRSKYAYTALKSSKAPKYNNTGFDQEFDEFLVGYSALLRKLRVPYRFVNEDQVEQGILDRYRLVIAPQASVLSAVAVERLSAYARLHPVIADQTLGTYDDHGCKRATAPFDFVQPDDLKLSDFGEHPLRNTDENLARLRKAVETDGVTSTNEVDGKGIDFIVRKRLGNLTLLVVFGQGALLVRPPEGMVAYDVRTHKLLGSEPRTMTQERSPAVLAFAKHKVAGIKLSATRTVKRGQEVTFEVLVQPAIATVVRLSATGPDGGSRLWYDVNVTVKGGKGNATFCPALNDPVGKWKFTATDVISGTKAATKVAVKEQEAH